MEFIKNLDSNSFTAGVLAVVVFFAISYLLSYLITEWLDRRDERKRVAIKKGGEEYPLEHFTRQLDFIKKSIKSLGLSLENSKFQHTDSSLRAKLMVEVVKDSGIFKERLMGLGFVLKEHSVNNISSAVPSFGVLEKTEYRKVYNIVNIERAVITVELVRRKAE